MQGIRWCTFLMTKTEMLVPPISSPVLEAFVPRGYSKVMFHSVCGPNGATVIPYPWSTQIYWCAESVVANSFLIRPTQSMAPVLKDSKEQRVESTYRSKAIFNKYQCCNVICMVDVKSNCETQPYASDTKLPTSSFHELVVMVAFDAVKMSEVSRSQLASVCKTLQAICYQMTTKRQPLSQ